MTRNMHDFYAHSRPMPLDQADGLRRMFAGRQRWVLPLVANPYVPFSGLVLDRLSAVLSSRLSALLPTVVPVPGCQCIARTEPRWKQASVVEEIRRLTLASIAAAKDTIYLENQYFTSPLVAEALAARLVEPDGPEVVLITTGHAPSWFDQATMDRVRGAMIWRLKASDVFGRFRAFYPITDGGTDVIVHSKTSVFDDRIARVGSANLNNRSGGFDTECELVVESDDPVTRRGIEAFRDRLVGHFIGYTGDAIARARRDFGGLGGAIDALNREGRLVPILPEKLGPLSEWMTRCHLGDPYDVSDSWRIGRRRERLYARVREFALLKSG